MEAVPPQALAKDPEGHLGQAGEGRLRLGPPGHGLLAGPRAGEVQGRQVAGHRPRPREPLRRASPQTHKGPRPQEEWVTHEYCRLHP